MRHERSFRDGRWSYYYYKGLLICEDTLAASRQVNTRHG